METTVPNNVKTKLEILQSYDEISDYIEQAYPFSIEEIKYLKQNLRKIINHNEGMVSDPSIIRFFLNIQKIFPDSDRLIYLIFQLNDEEVARSFIKEHKNEIIPIIKYAGIQPITENNMDWDEDSFWQPVVIDFELYNMERIVFYAEHHNSSVVLAFIEELLPYLYQPNFYLESNLEFLLKDQNTIAKYEEEHYYQGKVPLSVLFQVVNDDSSLLFKNLIKHIEDIEFYMSGQETLESIRSIFNHPYVSTIQETLKEKILSAIESSEEFTVPKNTHDLSTIRFLQNILYLQEEFIKGNPYFESELYQKCLNALFSHYKIEDKEKLKRKIEEYFKTEIIEKGGQEKDSLKRKENLLNTLLEILKTVSAKEILTFSKIGMPLCSSNIYHVEELESYDAKDFFHLLEIMKEKWGSPSVNLEELALQSLITLGKELAFFSTMALDVQNHTLTIKMVQNASEEEKDLSCNLLNHLLILIKKYQNHEPYKGTDLEKEAWGLYETWMKRKLNAEEIDSNQLRFIFHKVIQTGDLKTYLVNMNDLKRLTLAYKTPYTEIKENDFTLEQIKQFNPKQYSDIRNQVLLLSKKETKEFNEKNKNRKLLLFNSKEAERNTMALKLISYLDYELAKQMLKDPNITFSKLSSFLSGLLNPMPQIEGFKKCLKKQPYIFSLDSQLLSNYYNWYVDLSNNLNKEVTYQDIVKYESGARANLFDEPECFPISKNILLIQEKDWKRNAYKTTVLWKKQLKRLESTIPNVKGNFKEYSYQMVDLHDPDLIFLPNMINCCMEIGGKAEADLIHAVTNKNGRIFAVYQNKEVKAISWVWRNGEVLCFDNVEVKHGEETKQLGEILKEILIQASHDIIEISKEQEPPGEKIKTVTLGRNPRDVPMELEEKNLLSNYQKEMYYPEGKEDLYLVDSNKVQYIIGGIYTPISGQEVTTNYPYPRKEARNFEVLDIQYLDTSIKSIRKQKELFGDVPTYQYGYLGEDFYVGVTQSGRIDTVSLDIDSRAEKDIISSLDKVKEEYKQRRKVEEQQRTIIQHIMNTDYPVDSEQVHFLLEEIKKASNYEIDEDFYYHGSTLELILDMIRQGTINCRYRLGNRGKGSNGDYYVCVTKNLMVKNLKIKSSAFESYIRGNLSIILKKDLNVVDRSSQEFNFLDPFFEEGKRKQYHYDDEFQVRDKIEFPYFEGIYVPTKTRSDLISIRKIIDSMETFGHEIPIISNTSNTLIDKELIKTYLKKQTKGD